MSYRQVMACMDHVEIKSFDVVTSQTVLKAVIWWSACQYAK